jgi:hydrogenase-4 component E
MVTILLTVFAFTLFYIGIATRLVSYIRMLVFQGILLFGITFIELKDVNWINLALLLLETIVFKTFAIPYFLSYLIKKNKIIREAEPFVSNFWSLLIITALFLLSFILSGVLDFDKPSKIFVIVSFSTLLTGLYIIISRKKVITHVMGYLVLENGVFILSLAIGNHQPMFVNLGVLLDVFVSVLVLGIFINQIGNTFEEMNADNLSNLKD